MKESKESSDVKESVSRVQPINSIGSLLKYPDLNNNNDINGLSPFIADKSNLLVSNFTPSNFKTGQKDQNFCGANNSMPTVDIKPIFTSE